MRITVSSSIRADHDEIRELVQAGFRKINDRRVEVHVKGRTIRYRVETDEPGFYVSATRKRTLRLMAERYGHEIETDYGSGMKGLAYSVVPGVAYVAKGTEHLVTMSLPIVLEGLRYPRVSRYPGLKTAPPIALISWQENLLELTAHEARHTWQFRNARRQSEIDACRWSKKILDEIRLERFPTDPQTWASLDYARRLEADDEVA